jgi:hypothetical protein
MTSLSTVTRSQYSGIDRNHASKAQGRGSRRFCSGWQLAVFSKCFCKPGGNGPPRFASPGGKPFFFVVAGRLVL